MELKDEQISVLENKFKSDSANATLDQELEALFKSQWNILNDLCIKYFQQKGSDSGRKSLLTNIEHEISNLSQPKRIAEIERALNHYMSDIIIKLDEQCKFLGNVDRLIIILLFAGLTPNTICAITGLPLNTLYSKRRRLAERISKSGAKDSEWFISKMR